MTEQSGKELRQKLRELIPYLTREQIIDAFEAEMIADGYFADLADEEYSWEGYSPEYWLRYRIDELSEQCLEEALSELLSLP